MRGRVGADHRLHMLHRVLVPLARPNPIILVWRWRYEIALLVGLPLLLIALVEAVGPEPTMLTVIAGTTVCAGWPAVRRRLAARAWCILTPHRLRAGCAQAGIHTRHGRLPTIVWCAPREYGEQILIWCPAGVIADDFLAARHLLASACYAAGIDIATHPRYPHLTTLSVIRYPARR